LIESTSCQVHRALADVAIRFLISRRPRLGPGGGPRMRPVRNRAFYRVRVPCDSHASDMWYLQFWKTRDSFHVYSELGVGGFTAVLTYFGVCGGKSGMPR